MRGSPLDPRNLESRPPTLIPHYQPQISTCLNFCAHGPWAVPLSVCLFTACEAVTQSKTDVAIACNVPRVAAELDRTIEETQGGGRLYGMSCAKGQM